MKNINFRNLILASIVILCFVFVGFALGQKIFWLACLFLVLGFALMGVGISHNKKQNAH
ncbi:DUF5325 family protein [Halobacillus sp. Marseille-Q1614]|uniref:DUF5325 family protein n=1 Tax=Halobacillus sp. Marseille-Q1614 TaxID=2709134 RepID=UPI0015700ED7|nr:DUF5325 family protein [Halobacillus sp. Marseille-Q1614]